MLFVLLHMLNHKMLAQRKRKYHFYIPTYAVLPVHSLYKRVVILVILIAVTVLVIFKTFCKPE